MSMKFLPKEKGLKARQLIQGLIVSAKEDLEYSNVPKEELIKTALKLGAANPY